MTSAKNAKARCPTCRGVSLKEANKVFPFCSNRCQLIDLGRWLDEDYRVPEESDASGGGIEGIPRTDDER
ncbi:MAG TPA: DNA gyrase inhibitor YacG [Kofleriaceae bacterium]|nr:DNA gyrase inhibitor YacG [Kofleriaceae bacterium]